MNVVTFMEQHTNPEGGEPIQWLLLLQCNAVQCNAMHRQRETERDLEREIWSNTPLLMRTCSSSAAAGMTHES